MQTAEDDVVNSVYPDLQDNLMKEDWLAERAVLSSENEDVDKRNDMVMEKFPGELWTAEPRQIKQYSIQSNI